MVQQRQKYDQNDQNQYDSYRYATGSAPTLRAPPLTGNYMRLLFTIIIESQFFTQLKILKF